MIFFTPAYDAATQLNLAIARAIRPPGCEALFGAEATRERLLDALAENHGDPLFAMSHGEKDRLLAQNLATTEALALTASDAARIGRRPLFVFACHTASELGRDLAASGAVYWGYTGAINAPAENPELAPLFIPIFERIRDT